MQISFAKIFILLNTGLSEIRNKLQNLGLLQFINLEYAKKTNII